MKKKKTCWLYTLDVTIYWVHWKIYISKTYVIINCRVFKKVALISYLLIQIGNISFKTFGELEIFLLKQNYKKLHISWIIIEKKCWIIALSRTTSDDISSVRPCTNRGTRSLDQICINNWKKKRITSTCKKH